MMQSALKGSVKVSRRRDAMTTQTLRRGREPVSVLRGVLGSGLITALAAASRRRRVNVFWEAHVRPWTQGGSARM